MFESAKDFLEDIVEDVAEEFDELKDKLEEIFTEKLPELIDKWDFDSRPMEAHEINEAKKVFGDQLDYDELRIFEGAELPNFIDDIGRLLKGMDKRAQNMKNAITLGNWCIFGRELETEHPNDMAWMIHELTHAWQYQTLGWDYLSKALSAQKNLGAKAYDFGGEDGLKSSRKNGKLFKEFNMEQQGDITREYYQLSVKGHDTSAWDGYIDEIRKGAKKSAKQGKG